MKTSNSSIYSRYDASYLTKTLSDKTQISPLAVFFFQRLALKYCFILSYKINTQLHTLEKKLKVSAAAT